MNDTTPEMAKLQRDLIMQRSGADRLRMASSMFELAKALAYGSFGNVSEEEKQVRWFLRCYGNDFDAAAKERIVAGIRAQFHAAGRAPEIAQF